MEQSPGGHLSAANKPDQAGKHTPFSSIDAVITGLRESGYICERSLAIAIFLSLQLRRPLFLEGEAGVGKTEIAKVLAHALDRPLIRLQCYEGLDVAAAVYEWNYAAQMIEIRLAEAQGIRDRAVLSRDIFSQKFLIRRPLLQAIAPPKNTKTPILLIDELDRADAPFEAYLLEILSDFQITIPEIGPIKAPEIPLVILTSNRTREIHDAVKRRCLYHWLDYPDSQRELAIVEMKAPGVKAELSRQIVAFIQQLRKEDLFKLPGIAETIDWATALEALNIVALDAEIIDDTLGTILKYQDDIEMMRGAKNAAILANLPSTA